LRALPPPRCKLCAACEAQAIDIHYVHRRPSVRLPSQPPQGSPSCCAQARQRAPRLQNLACACQVGTAGYAEAVRYLLREAVKVKALAANRSDLAVEARAPLRRPARRGACSGVTGRPSLSRPRAEPRSAAHALRPHSPRAAPQQWAQQRAPRSRLCGRDRP